MVIDENDGFRKVLEALAEAAGDTGFSTMAKSYAKTYTDEEIKHGMIKVMTGGSVSPSLADAIHLKYDHAQPGFDCDCQGTKENVIKGRFPRKKTQAKKKAIEIEFPKPTSQS